MTGRAQEFAINDAVRLREDISDEGLRAGAIGVVVEVFDQPRTAYEVEFADGEGRTITELALLPAQIEPVG